MNPFNALRLLWQDHRTWRTLLAAQAAKEPLLAFYSESASYSLYLEDYLGYVLDHSSLPVYYLTSDPTDPMFAKATPRLRVHYLRSFLATALNTLPSSTWVMTMPDIALLGIDSTQRPPHILYVFHALLSTHLQYRFGAFDGYHTVFTVGPHQDQELRAAEERYQTPPRRLVPGGYARLDRIYREHQVYLEAHPPSAVRERQILIAPTWGPGTLLETCIIEEMVTLLVPLGHRIVIRPHPQFVRMRPDRLRTIQAFVAAYPQVTLETRLESDTSLHSADVLITDRSGIAYEYALGTERPALFIDTPLKTRNPRYEELGLLPLEVESRSKIGRALPPDRLSELPGLVTDFLQRPQQYLEEIRAYRGRILHHWGRSAEVVGEHLLSLFADGAAR